MVSANQEQIAREQWSATKVDIKKIWNRLTDRELDLVDGDFVALENLLKQKYGVAPADLHSRLEEISANFRRNLKQEIERAASPVDEERDGVRGTLRDQYRQF